MNIIKEREENYTEHRDKVIEHFEKAIRKGQKGFKEFDEVARKITQEFMYGWELNRIINEQQRIAGIGFIEQQRDVAPRRGFNTESRLTYFLMNNLARQENGLKITYNTTLETIMYQHEDYKYLVKGRLGVIGLGKKSGYEQIIKNQEITFEQKKLEKQRTLTIYPSTQTKIYLLNNEELQRIKQLLK